MYRTPSVLLAFAMALLALSACTERERAPSLPEGVQEARGTVRAAPISLSRRGTHLLIVEGNTLSFLESASVDLASFEGDNVKVTGRFIRNISSRDLPVLLVDRIELLRAASKQWTIPLFGIAFDAPADWTMTMSGSSVVFMGSGSIGSRLQISGQPLLHTPFAGAAERSEDQLLRLVVASRRALRLFDEDSADETVFVDRGPKSPSDATRVVVLQYKSPKGESTADARELMLRILTSFAFRGGASSASSSQRSAASASGAQESSRGAARPCGGPAGILCPAGQYCDITDLVANTGICKGR